MSEQLVDAAARYADAEKHAAVARAEEVKFTKTLELAMENARKASRAAFEAREELLRIAAPHLPREGE